MSIFGFEVTKCRSWFDFCLSSLDVEQNEYLIKSFLYGYTNKVHLSLKVHFTGH